MAAGASVKSAVWWGCPFLLGGVFGYAAVAKIADPQAFATDVDHYRLLPYPLTQLVGIYLPWLELVCSAGVLFRWRERGALVLLASLCGLFGIALALAWLRGLDIACGCFGHGAAAAASLPWALARSVGLGVVALLLLKAQPVDPSRTHP